MAAEKRRPRYGTDLRHKALLALEEACHDSRYRQVPRTYLLRFALAYLWSVGGGGNREPFTTFWSAIVEENELYRFTHADRALTSIYRAIGVTRDEDDNWAMWSVAQAEHERRSGRR